MNKKINLYAVYGTLKRGQGNYRLLDNEHSKFLGTTVTPKEFSLYHLGGFPGIKKRGNTEVEIEVFEVNNEVVEQRVDNLEGYNGNNNPHNLYNKEIINTKFGKAYIYTYNYEVEENRLIENGKWN